MDLKNFFVCALRPSKDNIISALRPSLKMVVENYIFWSEIRSGFREPGGTPSLRIPRSIPRGNIGDNVARLK